MRLDPSRSCRWAFAVGALGSVLASTGCGSTVAGTGAGGPVGSRGLGLSTSAGPASPQSGAVGSPGSGALQGTGGGSLPPGGGTGSAAVNGPGYGRAPVALTAGTSGPGYTAKQIFIGVAFDSTYSQELGQAGVTSGSTTVGDQQQQVNALIADINRRGGVAGRQLVPVFYDTKGASSQNDPGTLAQAACAKWTQDKLVFAAMTFVVQMDNPTLYNCLAKQHVIFVPLGGDSGAMLARYAPYLWAPSALTPERLAPVWIDRLVALGYFHGWDTTLGRPGNAPTRIGLLYGSGFRNGEPQLDPVFVQAIKQALARHGLQVTDEAQISNSQADEASAELRFRNDGVTHVIGDYSIVNFTTSAESQQYRPRYGFTSLGGGVALQLFATPDQLNGALGVGWVPSADVEAAQDPGDVSPAETHCRQVMTAAHQPTTTRLAWFAMTQACETFDFLAAAIAGSGLSSQRFPAAAAALGAFPPVSTFSIAFPRGRPDGANAVRDTGYDSGCSCFVYLSKTNHPA
jgi:Periplasmic binding protein